MLLLLFLSVWFLFVVSNASAQALTPEQALRIAQGDSGHGIAALNRAVVAADPALAAYVQALRADQVKIAAGRAFIARDEKATGAAASLPEGAEDVVNPNRVRRELEGALAALQLLSPDRSERLKAIAELKDQAEPGKLALFEKAEATETDPGIRAQLAMLKAAALINADDSAQRLAAAALLSGSDQPATKSVLLERLVKEGDAEVKAALNQSLAAVSSRLA